MTQIGAIQLPAFREDHHELAILAQAVEVRHESVERVERLLLSQPGDHRRGDAHVLLVGRSRITHVNGIFLRR